MRCRTPRMARGRSANLGVPLLLDAMACVTVLLCAQFLGVCSSSTLAAKLSISSVLRRQSSESRRVAWPCTRTHRYQLQATTNGYTLSEPDCLCTPWLLAGGPEARQLPAGKIGLLVAVEGGETGKPAQAGTVTCRSAS